MSGQNVRDQGKTNFDSFTDYDVIFRSLLYMTSLRMT